MNREIKTAPELAEKLQELFSPIEERTFELELKQIDLYQRANQLADSVQPKGYGPSENAQIRGVLGYYNHQKSPKQMARDNKYGIAEVVDTLTDVIKLADEIVDATTDGVQITDSFVILRNYPKVQEMVVDFKVFKQEFADLTDEEALQVVEQVAANTMTAPGQVRDKAIIAIDLAAEIYSLVDDVLERGKGIISKAKEGFGKVAA